MPDYNLPDPWKNISWPVELAYTTLVVLGLLLLRMLRINTADWWTTIALGLFAVAYNLFFFRWLRSRFPGRKWVLLVNTFLSIAFLVAARYLTGLQAEIDVLFVLVVVLTGIRLGPSTAALAALLAFAGSLLAAAFRTTLMPLLLVSNTFLLVVYLLAGYLSASLSGAIRRQHEETTRRNRNLALLLDMSSLSDSLDLETILPRLAEKIVKGLSSSYCSIHLLDPDSRQLVTRAGYPIRSEEAQAEIPPRQGLDKTPWHARAVETHQIVITRQDIPAEAMDTEERAAMLLSSIQSACLVPLVFGEQTLGVISIGEERKWEREPFSRAKIELLASIAAQAAVLVNNARLHQETRRQVERMAVINEITRAISSTLEMGDLLELIHQQISRVIPAETYFVGLYDERENDIDMRIILDEGLRFPPHRIPFGRGLTSYVIRERKPLLVRHMTEELDQLPVQAIVMGQEKRSESWLGVPILTASGATGVLAVASYQPNAFSEDDVALLSNVANQAALALDNARHHAEVVEQSRRDSLTGVYNHGYFLLLLDQEIQRARLTGQPVAMIMIDVDHFKSYNDTYGHVIGDEVLRLTVQAIQAKATPDEISGRWGGEEFGIILPGMTASEAATVAEQIRLHLAATPVVDSSGRLIPPPTISQGIASFPQHASSASRLVDVADQALYVAKGKGRDQIQMA